MTGRAPETVRRGHCLCGACRFELTGAHNWTGHCHCESCRRATASPFTTWIGHANGRWRWTGDAPKVFDSSPGAQRGCCAVCGSPMFYRHERYPGETHFYAALLENGSPVEPTAHFHSTEQLGWIHLADTLERR